MYKKVSTDMNFVGREKEVEAFWKEHDIFQKSMEEKEGCPEYTFYDGPPTANGKPHIGHVLTRVIKDMIPRYRTMKGYKVPRKAGWDTHGLPVELEVEKLLGLDGKDQIQRNVGGFLQHGWILGRYGASLCNIRQQFHRIRVVGIETDLGQKAPLQRI